MPAQSNLRVSDAARAEVADRLSRHYGDGRLDEAEFNERVDRAMKAKTHADFSGLFDDLPGEDLPGGTTPGGTRPAPPSQAAVPRAGGWPVRARYRHPVVTLVVVVVLITAIAHAAAQFFVPWLLIGFLAFLW